MPFPPEKAYGILRKDTHATATDVHADQIRRLGYAVVDSGFSADEIATISKRFEKTRNAYVEKWGSELLRAADEHNGIRLPMAIEPNTYRKLALNTLILGVVERLIDGQFILNQQNGVINPTNATYNQGQWHRDLPYQHFLSSTPLAINALYCVDDFTVENGSTWVLPATHKTSSYPSEDYVARHALQVTAKAGQYIVLDCMLYHSGGFNASAADRRAVNHVYTIPYMSQQIRIPGNVDEEGLTDAERRILGFSSVTPQSVGEYLDRRIQK